jgi:putative hydrolase of HD superfamily
MNSREIIKFLGLAEKLKCELRHSWTSTMRQESVAEHSWRLCVFSWLLKDQLQNEYDMDKVLKMCLFHDLGEAIAGDVPSFLKSNEDIRKEDAAIEQIVGMLDHNSGVELKELFAEMKEQSSKEARLFNALDKLEAVIQHNEAPIDTWIPPCIRPAEIDLFLFSLLNPKKQRASLKLSLLIKSRSAKGTSRHIPI